MSPFPEEFTPAVERITYNSLGLSAYAPIGNEVNFEVDFASELDLDIYIKQTYADAFAKYMNNNPNAFSATIEGTTAGDVHFEKECYVDVNQFAEQWRVWFGREVGGIKDAIIKVYMNNSLVLTINFIWVGN